MIDWLIDLDRSLFLILNGIGHPYLDQFMLWMSDKYIWIPLYGYIIFRLYQVYGRRFYQPLLAIILVIVIADQTTSGFMKPFFERLRPCKDPIIGLETINIGKCGGKYGFASSHAANTIGLASSLVFLSKTRLGRMMMAWAIIVSYSRIYLGVHYPGDVIVGGLVGVIGAYISYALLIKWNREFKAG